MILGGVVVLIVIVGTVMIANQKSGDKTAVSNNSKTQSQVQSSQTQGTKTQTQAQITDPNAAKYEGQDNLKKFEDIAEKNSTNADDQVNAAVSAFVNKDYDKAVSYYQRAISLQPKNPEYYTYLGNVYYRGLNNPEEAIKYYQAATTNGPKYGYGWLNLALANITLGNKEAAKEALQKGLANVDAKDPLHDQIQKQLDTIK